MANIQWYPGHMNKAKNQLEDKLDLIDVIIEVLDARLPMSSKNPMISKLIANKAHIIILNKADLADAIKTKTWVKFFQKQGILVLPMDAQHSNNMSGLIKLIKIATKDKVDKIIAKGAKEPVIKVAIAGIPNCGKSTIINRLVGRNATIVGDKPGVTRGQNWLKTDTNIQILDTPGILWPKFDDRNIGLKLAACGAIKDSVFHADDVSIFVLKYLREQYLNLLVDFCKTSAEKIEKINDIDLLLAMTQLFGMRDDYERFSIFFLQRLRKGKIGRITFDLP